MCGHFWTESPTNEDYPKTFNQYRGEYILKKINYVKLSLDVVMALLFVLFFNTRVLGGLPFHEIAGLFFAAMYFTHILLNWRWVAKVTRKLFDRKLPWKVRGSYGLNLLLLISMSFIIISGILISRVVFPAIKVTNERWFHVTHVSVSYLVLLLIGVHVGLHWQWIMNMWKKIWKLKSNNAWSRYAARILTVFILLFGVYQISSTGFVHRVSGVTSVFGGSSMQKMQRHPGGEGFHGSRNGMEPGEGHDFDPGMKPAGGEQMNQNPAPPTMEDGKVPPQKSIAAMKQHRGGSAQLLQVIVTETGIMAVFVIITYYLTRLAGRRKKKV